VNNSIPCPKCNSILTYEYNGINICPECNYEWGVNDLQEEQETKILDVNGNELKEGDQVALIKDLKVKNSSTTIKMGSKFKITRLLDGDHNIDCKGEGVGAIMLKSEFVKKINKA